MKTIHYLALTFVLIFATSCASQIEETVPKEQEITITASFANIPESKSTLIDGGTTVYWEPGDEIKLFSLGASSRLRTTAETLVQSASFTGNVPILIGSNEGMSISNELWAIYPYRTDASSDGKSITTTLPDEQTAQAGSFRKDMNITMAKSNSFDMCFYNVCGGLRFKLVNEGINKVTFTSGRGEKIAGTFNASFTNGIPIVKSITEGKDSIVLSMPHGEAFEKGEWYYICAIPGNLEAGFTMRFDSDNQYALLSSNKSVTIKRGVFGQLVDVDKNLVFTDKDKDNEEGGFIQFADPAAKYACVVKFDTNDDNEVSYAEAEAATSFNGLSSIWKNLTSFDEIKFFMNIHSISGVFEGCSQLTSIDIPDNITDLGVNAFRGCSSLTSVKLPKGIKSIGDYTFYDCSNLASIDLPTDINTIGNYAFYGCSSLASVYIPSEVSSIGEFAFYNCSKLESVDLPSGITTIGRYAFSGCTNLASVNVPSGLSSISNGCFQDCRSLKAVNIPTGVESIGDYSFSGVRMWKLELPPSVTSIGSHAFSNITCIIIPSTTSVSVSSSAFSTGVFGVKGLFVPSVLINEYKSRWGSNYSSQIYALESFKEKSEFTLATSGAVDMGTSVKWAACDFGATNPKQHGDKYQWAGTDGVSYEIQYPNESNCPYHTGSNESTGWTKYIPSAKSTYWSGTGSPDNKTVLDLDDDVAHLNLGGKWRIPTNQEWEELKNKCIWEETSYEGIDGLMFFGIGSGNKIFMSGSNGRYWSSSLSTKDPYSAYYSGNISESMVVTGSVRRSSWMPIRPVSE